MTNIPDRIFLQIGEDCPSDADFNELGEVSWCDDRINENDLEYKLVKKGRYYDKKEVSKIFDEPTPEQLNEIADYEKTFGNCPF